MDDSTSRVALSEKMDDIKWDFKKSLAQTNSFSYVKNFFIKYWLELEKRFLMLWYVERHTV